MINKSENSRIRDAVYRAALTALLGVLAVPPVLAVSAAFDVDQAQYEPSQAVRYRDPVFETVDRNVDIVYGRARDIPSGDVVELKLDLYEPAGDSEPARPVLIFIHGGGFTGGNKSAGRPWGLEFARRGWVVASIGYRLNQGNLATEGIPAAVSDARQAVRWLGNQADALRLDPSRFAIGGSSAGAITALFLAYTDISKDDAADEAGVVAVMDLWGGLYGQEQGMTAGEPPLVIIHGTEDSVVPFTHAEALKARAEAVGIPFLFRPLEGVGHGWGETATMAEWTAEFFYPHLWPEQEPTPTGTSGTLPPPQPTTTGEATGTASSTATAGTSAATSTPPTGTRIAVQTPGPSPTPDTPTADASGFALYLPWLGQRGDASPAETPTSSAPEPTGEASPTADPSASPTAPAAEIERVVTILVDDGGSSDPRISLEQVDAVLADISEWYREVSYGRAELTFDVHGWYDIAMTAGNATDSRIYSAAAADGVDFRQYEHVLVLFHGGSGFGSSNRNHSVVVEHDGESYPLEATVSQITRARDTSGTRGVATHELGHALGLPHANHLSQITGAPVAYGTLVDTMGASSYRGHFNAYYKHQLGWLDADDVVVAETSMTVQLHALEADAGTRLIRIPADTLIPVGERELRLGDYVIEARRAIGADSELRHNVLDGVLIYRLAPIASDPESDARFQTISIDASPETASNMSDDFALMPGRTWSDPANSLHITVVGTTPDDAWVRVERDPRPANQPPVITQIGEDSVEGNPLTRRFYVEATDPDGDVVHAFWNFEVRGDPGGTGGRGLITRHGPGTYGWLHALGHTFSDDEPRSVCVVVTDTFGGEATDCVDVFGATNSPPEVTATAAPGGPATVQLSARILDGQPTWVKWDFGDGLTAPFVSPVHRYAEPGIYTASVTVSDGKHVVTHTIEVDATQSDNIPPVAVAGADQTVAPGATVRLSGRASYDPDRYPIDQLRYIWSAPPEIVLATERGADTSFVAPDTEGSYTLTLQVYDGAVYASDEVVVTVQTP